MGYRFWVLYGFWFRVYGLLVDNGYCSGGRRGSRSGSMRWMGGSVVAGVWSNSFWVCCYVCTRCGSGFATMVLLVMGLGFAHRGFTTMGLVFARGGSFFLLFFFRWWVLLTILIFHKSHSGGVGFDVA